MDQNPTHADYLNAYASCKSDPEASKLLGIPRRTFLRWRQMHGYPALQAIPANLQPFQVSPKEHERRTEAWSTSMDFAEAAEKTGLTYSNFQLWAKSQGLPSPMKFRTVGRQGEQSKDARYSRAYNEAKSDKQAAEFLGVNQKAFMRWRRHHKLPPTSVARRKWLYEQKKLAQAELDRQLKEGI
jgi:hypothetical protein